MKFVLAVFFVGSLLICQQGLASQKSLEKQLQQRQFQLPNLMRVNEDEPLISNEVKCLNALQEFERAIQEVDKQLELLERSRHERRLEQLRRLESLDNSIEQKRRLEQAIRIEQELRLERKSRSESHRRRLEQRRLERERRLKSHGSWIESQKR